MSTGGRITSRSRYWPEASGIDEARCCHLILTIVPTWNSEGDGYDHVRSHINLTFMMKDTSTIIAPYQCLEYPRDTPITSLGLMDSGSMQALLDSIDRATQTKVLLIDSLEDHGSMLDEHSCY
jgi:hypothetical protein